MGMRRFLTVQASTKRAPAMVGGRRGAAVAYLTAIKCMPLDPVDAELRQRLALNAPHELLQTVVEEDVDVREGDFLVVTADDCSTVEYPVRACEDWVWGRKTFRRLILEDLKR